MVLTKARDDDNANNWFDVLYSDWKASTMERVILFINEEGADGFALSPGLAAHVKAGSAELLDRAGLSFNPMLIVQRWPRARKSMEQCLSVDTGNIDGNRLRMLKGSLSELQT